MGRTWHLILALVVCAALVLQIALIVVGGQDVSATHAAMPTELGTRLLRLFSYFTIQSNLLVLWVAVSLALAPRRDGRWWRVLRLDALLGIAITGIVFVTVLLPLVDPSGAAAWANAGLHYFAPIGALAGWVLFGPRDRIDARTIALAFAWPLAWLAYTLVHGATSGWYPYPFLDAGKLGYPRVLGNIAVVVSMALVLALLMQWLDRVLPGRMAKPDAERHPAS